MPFPDEIRPVRVIPYQEAWASEFTVLAVSIRELCLADRGIVEHVGSTAVRGLAAKDVIDVQVRVPKLDDHEAVTARFASIGFRHRPEPWNNVESTRAGSIPKLVFAPPPGSRACNVHVRVDGSQGALDTLLFRDFLAADEEMRSAWGKLKVAAASVAADQDLTGYARIKDPAWRMLMAAADAWAQKGSWRPTPLGAWR